MDNETQMYMLYHIIHHPATKCTCTNPQHNYLIIEKVDGMGIELEGECLKERYIVGQNFLI